MRKKLLINFVTVIAWLGIASHASNTVADAQNNDRANDIINNSINLDGLQPADTVDEKNGAIILESTKPLQAPTTSKPSSPSIKNKPSIP